MEIVDLHNHLLPAVDDGSESLDESLRHLRLLFVDGVRKLAVSPHLFGWLTEEVGGLEARMDRLDEVFLELESAAQGHADVPQLFFSQEILCPTPEIARAVFANDRPGLRNSSYALVEFGFDLPNDVGAIVRTVLDSGRRIIVSHPERYRRNRGPVTVEEVVSWKRAGACLQINGGSLLGDYGEPIKRTAWRLLREGIADIISTDHHADHRPVSPADVAHAIAARGGHEQARILMAENTRRILEDLDLLSVPPLPDRTAA